MMRRVFLTTNNGSSLLRSQRHFFWLFFCLFLLCVVVIASFCIGARPFSFSDILSVVQGGDTGLKRTILLEGRLPRTLMGVFVGMALGVSGALIQAITRNPLADPSILGVNLGASFAVAFAILFLGAGTLSEFVGYAFIGVMLTSLLVYWIGSRGPGKVNPLKLTLSGVAVGAVFSGLSSAMTLFHPDAFDQVRFWTVGTLDVQTLSVPLMIAPIVLCGCLLAFSLTPSLNALGLGEALASSLGARLLRTQVLSLIAITLLCGCATAAAGPIGFVSLMMPHIARWMVGPDQRWILPFCCVLTPSLLLFSDIIGRLIVVGELRVSIVTAFIGAPVLIYLVRRQRAVGI